MDIQGQAALVTGGGSGLGAAAARELARHGARVAILDVNLEAAEHVAAQCGGVAFQADVTSSASIGAAIARARGIHGAARILVNCAGIGTAKRLVGKDGPMPLEAFTRVIQVNLVGTFDTMRQAAQDMCNAEPLGDGERGVIINTSSVAAYDGQVGQAAYAASKGAIAALTLPLARELAQFGVRVVTIAPGLFETPLLEQLPPDVQAALGASIPFPKRLGRPDEFARLAAHIVTNLSLNGEVIRLDGALRLPPR